MGDERIRSMASSAPAPELGPTMPVDPPPLAEARVAIVTTAALFSPGGAPVRGGDPGFTVLDDGADLRLGHESMNFDRSGWTIDPNVVFPRERLHEMANDGVIGSVARRHLSFAGNQQPSTLSAIAIDSGPAAAALLREDGVNVVVLTPI
jgi:D-proline reductase (dithiol) PrdB